jgi:hypothetical protein
VFFINVPIGVVVLALLVRLLPAMPAWAPPGSQLDVPGAVLVAAATGIGIHTLITAGDIGWLAPGTIAGVAASALLYAVFVLRQRIAQSTTEPRQRCTGSGSPGPDSA